MRVTYVHLLLAVTRAPTVIWLTLFSGAMKYTLENSFWYDILFSAYSTSTDPQMCCGGDITQSMFMCPCRYRDSTELLITPLSPINLLNTNECLLTHKYCVSKHYYRWAKTSLSVTRRTTTWRFLITTLTPHRWSTLLGRWPCIFLAVWIPMNSSRTQLESYLALMISTSIPMQTCILIFNSIWKIIICSSIIIILL